MSFWKRQNSGDSKKIDAYWWAGEDGVRGRQSTEDFESSELLLIILSSRLHVIITLSQTFGCTTPRVKP